MNQQSLISQPASPIKSHTYELIEEHFMFVYYSLNFLVLHLFHLGSKTASWMRDSLPEPTAVTVLIRLPAGIVNFSNKKTCYNQKTQRLEKQNISLKLMHGT